jgi:transposase
MMGKKERSFAPLINVSLEALVPQDHFYRHLERTLDLSFVREFVHETYAGSGRPSIDPVVFFKLQLVMFFEDIRSERLLMRHAADRLSVRWYLGVRHVTQGSIPSQTERTRRKFFGSRAYLAPKGNGDNSMLLKQDAAKAL